MNTSDCIKCDVLVCGGGVGGLAAAISIKELAPETDVLVVEKNFSGWSGKANRGGGVLQYFDYDKIKPEEFAAFHAHEIGAYLGDQELMTTYVAMNHQMMDKLSSWGVNMPRNDDGAYRVMPTGPFTCIICVDLDITLNMRRHAKKLGVRFMDKTVMAELFRDEHGITGAGVYSVLDGTYTTVSAKRVVLATGSQDYRVGPMWSCGRGDGILAAWKAGAEMRNPEFGNFAQLVLVRSHDEIVFGENYMYNAKGEFLTPHFFDHRETDISSKAIREWLIQMEAGDGPVHLDFGGKSRDEMSLERQWYRPYGQRFRELINENAARVDTDLEVAPMFIGVHQGRPRHADHRPRALCHRRLQLLRLQPGRRRARPSGTQPRLGHPQRGVRRHHVLARGVAGCRRPNRAPHPGRRRRRLPEPPRRPAAPRRWRDGDRGHRPRAACHGAG